MDQVRRREHKTLRAAGDDRLTGTRYDWLRHLAAMEPKDWKEFAALRNSNLKTARAWALKETGMALFEYQYERPARKHFRWWHGWAVRSRLKPMIEVARMLKRRFENIITYLRQTHHQRGQRIDQREDPMGEVHGPGIPQQEELPDGDLLPLRRSGYGPVMPLKSRKSQMRILLSVTAGGGRSLGLFWLTLFGALGLGSPPQDEQRPLNFREIRLMLERDEQFSMGGIWEEVSRRGVDFELTEASIKALREAGRARDRGLMERLLQTIAERCVACVLTECELAKRIIAGSPAAALFLELAAKRYEPGKTPKIPELLLGTVPAGQELSGGMVALLCRVGAEEERLAEALSIHGIAPISNLERDWILKSCPSILVSRIERLLSPRCGADQLLIKLEGTHLAPRSASGQLEVAVWVDHEVTIHLAEDTVCVETLQGAPPRASQPNRYQGGPLPARPPEEWQFVYQVVSGPGSQVTGRAVEGALSPRGVPSLQFRVKDIQGGAHLYRLRISWALQPFQRWREIEQTALRIWNEEFASLLRDVQRQGVNFSWDATTRSQLRNRQVPKELIPWLEEVKPSDCDATPYSVEEFWRSVEKAEERYTQRMRAEVETRGVNPSIAKNKPDLSPIWNEVVVRAINENSRTHNYGAP